MIIQNNNQGHTQHARDNCEHGCANDSFDAFLTKHLQQANNYLPDENFSAQVMQQLPAPKKLSRWQERLIILLPLMVISLLVLSQFSILAVLIKIWTLLLTIGTTGLLQMGILTTIAVISGVTCWFAKQYE